MKRYITILLALFAFTTVFAQHKEQSKNQPIEKQVIELVNDLSAIQKHKLESLQKESKERIDRIKRNRTAVHDSINAVFEKYGDHTKELSPLIERDAALQAELSREYYRIKVRIDEILTRDQAMQLRAKLKEKCEKNESKHKHKK
ncbi:MAG: hypothetical protein IJ789_06445 [Bacteroidales bacterium]|nr:hypothetical protein [Bacteroidales bacterium]